MAINETRIDRAEAEALARLKPAIRAFVDWVETGTPEEQAAYWRCFAKDPTPEEVELLMDGRREPTPEDEALAAAFDARCPAELVEALRTGRPTQ